MRRLCHQQLGTAIQNMQSCWDMLVEGRQEQVSPGQMYGPVSSPEAVEGDEIVEGLTAGGLHALRPHGLDVRKLT